MNMKKKGIINKIKDNRGFTFVELMAVIAVLGILIGIAVPGISKLLANFRINYYKKLEGTVTQAAKDFYQDNLLYRPNDVLKADHVEANTTLVTKNYIDEVKDYRGKTCNGTYTVVISKGNGEYIYQTCLKCRDDNYETESKYCDPAWLNNENISYEFGNTRGFYIYYNTPREKVREKLKTGLNAIKRNASGQELEIVAIGDENSTVLPNNINELNTTPFFDETNRKEFILNYTSNNENKELLAIVYKHKAPKVTISDSNGHNYDGTWADKVIIKLEINDNFFKETNTTLKNYEWNINGSWEKVTCTMLAGTTCTIATSDDMNNNVRFRFVTNEGNISDESSDYYIKIDNSKPKVTIDPNGGSTTMLYGSNDATLHANVTITDEGRSGMAFMGYALNSNQTLEPSDYHEFTSMEYELIENISSGVTFIWIKAVDNAGNTSTEVFPSKEFRMNYEILFDANGGTGEPDTQYKVYGQPLILPSSTPTKSGVTFGGWSTSSDALVKDYDASGKYTANEPAKLYAVWNKKITVNFDANGGTVQQSSKEVVLNEQYGELPIPVRNGYTFIGWYTDKTDGTQVVDTTKVTNASEHTLYAHWGQNVTKVTVSFDGNGISINEPSKEVIVGQAYGTLPTPTDDNYVFVGWYTGKTDGTKVTDTTTVTNSSNHTLYARWKGKDVTVTFDANGGLGVSKESKTVTYGGTYGELATATNASNYKFLGWYTERTGGSKVVNTTPVLKNSDHTLYAHWEEIITKVTVSFDGNGISINEPSKEVTVGKAYGTLPTPTNDNYVFVGWYTSQSGGTKVTDTTTVTNSSNHTLYARWQGKEMTVTFDANGGLSVSKKSKTVTYGGTYGDLGTATNTDGYVFLGWYTERTGGSKVVSTTPVTKNSDHTLYAHWGQNVTKVTVSFDGNGISINEPSKEVIVGQAYGTLPTPTDDNYVFVGWYTGKTDGTKVTDTTTVTNSSNHTLYARWQGKEMTVTFDANGGLGVSKASKTVTYGGTYGELATATNASNYKFLGWYTERSGGSKVVSTTPVTKNSDHTLYAHWEEIITKVTVSFDGNGVQINEPSKEVIVGQAYGTLPTPTDSNYVFVGWYTGKTDGTKVTDTTTVTNSSNHTLYARWQGKEMTVTFDANGGLSVSKKSKTVTYGGTYGELATATSGSDYDFVGWYTDPIGGSKVVNTTPVTKNSDHTLYAHWKKNTVDVTVSFNANGGKSVSQASKTVTVGKTYGVLPTATSSSGYSFAGWYTDPIGGSKVTSASTVTRSSNHTLYAHWDRVSVTVYFNVNGGVSVTQSSKTVNVEDLYGQLPTASSGSDYKFVGWYTSSSGGTEVNASTKVTQTVNHTLYAHWQKNATKVTVYFNGNGGSPSQASKEYTVGGKYTGLPTASRSNSNNLSYTFAGWYTSQNGGTKVTDTTTVTNSSNHTLYAHWNSNVLSTHTHSGEARKSYARQDLTYDTLKSWATNSYNHWCSSPDTHSSCLPSNLVGSIVPVYKVTCSVCGELAGGHWCPVHDGGSASSGGGGKWRPICDAETKVYSKSATECIGKDLGWKLVDDGYDGK